MFARMHSQVQKNNACQLSNNKESVSNTFQSFVSKSVYNKTLSSMFLSSSKKPLIETTSTQFTSSEDRIKKKERQKLLHKHIIDTTLNKNFLKGSYYFWNEHYKLAKTYYLKALDEAKKNDKKCALYHSYLGLTEILTGRKSGLHRCYRAANYSSNDVEIHINVSCAEMIMGNRKRATEILSQFSEQKVSNKSRRMMQMYYETFGQRKQNDSGQFKRDSFVHKVAGKYFRNDATNNVSKVKAFLTKNIKLSYQETIHILHSSKKMF